MMETKILLLGGDNATTWIVYNELVGQFGQFPAIIEQSLSRRVLLQNRLKKIGVRRVASQILFALLARPVDLHRHLIGGAADALGAHLDHRLDMLDGLVEHVDGFQVGHAFLDLVEGTVEDAHRRRLLALPHQAIDELARQLGIVARVRLKGLGARGPLGHDYIYPGLCCLAAPRRGALFPRSVRGKSR